MSWLNPFNWNVDIVVEVKIDPHPLGAIHNLHNTPLYLPVRSDYSIQTLKDDIVTHFDLGEYDFSLFGLQNTTEFLKDENYILQNLVNDGKPIDTAQKVFVFF
jgi:hypothetical protein